MISRWGLNPRVISSEKSVTETSSRMAIPHPAGFVIKYKASLIFAEITAVICVDNLIFAFRKGIAVRDSRPCGQNFSIISIEMRMPMSG